MKSVARGDSVFNDITWLPPMQRVDMTNYINIAQVNSSQQYLLVAKCSIFTHVVHIVSLVIKIVNISHKWKSIIFYNIFADVVSYFLSVSY